VRVPVVLDENLALLLGMYASEGHTSRSNWSIVITNSVPEVRQRATDLWAECFGVTARMSQHRNRCGSTVAASKTIVEVMSGLGCGSRASEKRIPLEIMESPRPVVLAFLQGLWLDAYTSVAGMARWGLCLDSPELLDDVQTLLRRLGVVTGRVTKYNPTYDKSYDEVYATGENAKALVRLVPFLEPDKAAAAQRLLHCDIDVRRNGADVVPLVHGSALYAEIPKGRGGRSGAGTGVAVQWRSLCDKRTVWPSRHVIERIAEAGYRLPPDVQRVLDERLHFSPVVSTAAGQLRRSRL
jgi:intein/homing endonuclease